MLLFTRPLFSWLFNLYFFSLPWKYKAKHVLRSIYTPREKISSFTNTHRNSQIQFPPNNKALHKNLIKKKKKELIYIFFFLFFCWKKFIETTTIKNTHPLEQKQFKFGKIIVKKFSHLKETKKKNNSVNYEIKSQVYWDWEKKKKKTSRNLCENYKTTDKVVYVDDVYSERRHLDVATQSRRLPSLNHPPSHCSQARHIHARTYIFTHAHTFSLSEPQLIIIYKEKRQEKLRKKKRK